MTTDHAERRRIAAACAALVARYPQRPGTPAEPSRRPPGEDARQRADHIACELRRALLGVTW